MIAEKLLYVAIFMAEAITAWLYFSYIYKQEKNSLYTSISFALGYTLLFLASQLSIVVLNASLFFVVNTAILYLNYSCEIKSSVLHAAFLTLTVSISEILVNLLITVIVKDYNAYTYSMPVLFRFAVFSKLLYFFITVVGARAFKPHKGHYNEPSQLVLLCVMPVVSVIIIVTFIYLGSNGQLTDLTEILVTVSTMALLFVNIVVLFIYNRIQKLDEEHAALQIAQLKDQADTEYYKMLQQQYDGQRILIHDIKNHFNVIRSMAEDGDNGKIREYISELEALPEFQHRARMCDDPILNMILIRNADYCSAKNISFFCDVRAGSVSFMDATSITALFGNLLSNAVEAAEKSEGKMVELSVIKNVEQNNVLVSVVNSCDEAPLKDASGELITSKDSGEGHGYGTKSIARVVTKYDGRKDFRYEKDAREFHFIICFPLH